MAKEQKFFIVNCVGCGRKIEVANPRLDEEPKRVYASEKSAHGSSKDQPYSWMFMWPTAIRTV